MKRTDRLTNWIAILLFLALLAYIGAYASRSLRRSTVTAQAVAVDLAVGGSANGLIVRDETVLRSDEPFVDVSAAEGAKVARGAKVATVIRSDVGRARASRMHELELEISRVTAALQARSSAEDLTSRDAALRAGVTALTASIARHRLATLEGAVLNLRTLLFPPDEDVSEEKLRALSAELDSLKNSSSSDTTELLAEAAGTFSSAVDGFEVYGPDDVQDLLPSELLALIESDPAVPDGAFGKLVGGYRWYFAAVMDAVDAAKLNVGKNATLNFGRWYGADIPARVLGISAQEDGSVVVLFRCATALADTLSLRSVSAEIVFDSYHGIRIPAQAVQTDPETERTYVWCVTAMQLEQKDIEIIYMDEDYVIISENPDADALRPGNTVVVSGADLYEGKVIE
jgi:putative membrane fusion protein